MFLESTSQNMFIVWLLKCCLFFISNDEKDDQKKTTEKEKRELSTISVKRSFVSCKSCVIEEGVVDEIDSNGFSKARRDERSRRAFQPSPIIEVVKFVFLVVVWLCQSVGRKSNNQWENR